jgi:hypothetical protein
LSNGTTCATCQGQHDSTCLANTHGCADIVLEKDLLDSNRIWSELGQQGLNFAMNFG